MGRHIIFEGLDGAGKSTQISLTKEWLEESGRTVWDTRTPSYHPVGTLTRGYFDKAESLFPDERVRNTFMGSLIAADMLEHDLEVREKLAEEEGDDLFVLHGRTWISTYCYHALAHGVQSLLLMEVAPNLTKPHGIIFLHAEIDVCLERIRNREQAVVDLYERKTVLERVMKNWALLKKYLTDYQVLDLDTTLLSQEEVFDHVKRFMNRWGMVHGD